ncbi:hypothetical protein DL93DRAFT_2108678 [Clavulina sp. PMI_390]|nr:hypothetical protein DL93DRAFT_2108678 [Clavulina sp. PMI_390]
MEVPPIVRKFYSYFPLYYNEDETVNSSPPNPTLWVAPGFGDSPLSGDIECLKWQTYLALRKTPSIRTRYDVQPDGGPGGILPALHLPNGEVLSPARIPGWADEILAAPLDPLEGYPSEKLRDESRAWISLFEGVIHGALLVTLPLKSTLKSSLDPSADKSASESSISSFFHPPLAPVTGIWSVVPPYGLNLSYPTVIQRYEEAINAVSERLGSDQWFLGSQAPTALDAVMFSYLHRALNHKDSKVITAVRTRVNLVVWERKVRALVVKATVPASPTT